MAKKVDTSKMTRKQREAYEAQQKMKKAMIGAGIAVILFVAMFGLYYIISEKQSTPPANDLNITADPEYTNTASLYARPDDPEVTMTMSDGSVIKMTLYPAAAPNTVANFIELANSGYYDGLTFHRVISGFMIQGGDPEGDGTGGPGYTIEGEFVSNGHDNMISHVRGIVSMARANDPNSAGSQFFIMHGDANYLDGQYAAFGEVTEGMDVVDKIAQAEKDSNDKPLEDVVIESVTVDTKGIEYSVVKYGE